MVLSIKLRLQLADASFHLVHGLLASLKSVSLGLIQALLHVLDLALKKLAVLLKALSNILLRAQLISNASSINHCLLGFLLRNGGLTAHLIQISMQGLHLRLELPLGSSDGLVLASQVRELLVGVRQLLLSHTASPVSLFQKSPGFLQSILNRVRLALSGDKVVPGDLLGTLLLLQLRLSVTDLVVVLLDGLLGLLVGSVGMLQRSLKLSNVSLQQKAHGKTAVTASLSPSKAV